MLDDDRKEARGEREKVTLYIISGRRLESCAAKSHRGMTFGVLDNLPKKKYNFEFWCLCPNKRWEHDCKVKNKEDS